MVVYLKKLPFSSTMDGTVSRAETGLPIVSTRWTTQAKIRRFFERDGNIIRRCRNIHHACCGGHHAAQMGCADAA